MDPFTADMNFVTHEYAYFHRFGHIRPNLSFQSRVRIQRTWLLFARLLGRWPRWRDFTAVRAMGLEMVLEMERARRGRQGRDYVLRSRLRDGEALWNFMGRNDGFGARNQPHYTAGVQNSYEHASREPGPSRRGAEVRHGDTVGCFTPPQTPPHGVDSATDMHDLARADPYGSREGQQAPTEATGTMENEGIAYFLGPNSARELMSPPLVEDFTRHHHPEESHEEARRPHQAYIEDAEPSPPRSHESDERSQQHDDCHARPQQYYSNTHVFLARIPDDPPLPDVENACQTIDIDSRISDPELSCLRDGTETLDDEDEGIYARSSQITTLFDEETGPIQNAGDRESDSDRTLIDEDEPHQQIYTRLREDPRALEETTTGPNRILFGRERNNNRALVDEEEDESFFERLLTSFLEPHQKPRWYKRSHEDALSSDPDRSTLEFLRALGEEHVIPLRAVEEQNERGYRRRRRQSAVHPPPGSTHSYGTTTYPASQTDPPRRTDSDLRRMRTLPYPYPSSQLPEPYNFPLPHSHAPTPILLPANLCRIYHPRLRSRKTTPGVDSLSTPDISHRRSHGDSERRG
ncbi:Hypothetical predicted protein [Lecanosticta acicola]|uniref:Uncharacterized protein n=1 Tax=Lecanosticta acicola TaxID=111012 RepID=A0AAI8YW23_9PEZI|nr:Hypothetical predicted protein [Lecanosticta acicola]